MLIKPMPAPADPNEVCKTCGHYYPGLQVCAADDSLVTEADAKVRSCNNWEPRKEKLNAFTATETIGMDPVNPAEGTPEAYGPVITECRTGDHRCRNCAYCNPDTNHCTVRSRVMSSPSTTVCMQWAAKQTQPVFGGTSLKELEEKQKSTGWDHRLEAKTLDRGAKQGMTLEALDTVFAIACQQVPSMEKRWMELRAEINVMFAQKWATEDMPE